MEDLVLVLITLSVLSVSVAVTYHAAHADNLWPFGKPEGRQAVPTVPWEVPTTVEFADYVRRGLEDLAVMLAQAARKRPH